jgi:hypothetical protein
VLEQRIGRIYRLGQKHPIDVFNLVSEAGIESRIAELIGTKQALFSGLFDGTTDEIRFDGASSFLTRVERLLDPGPLPEAPRAMAAEISDEVETDDSEEVSTAEPSKELSMAPSGHESGGQTAAPGDSIAALLGSVRVERTSDGSVRFEAPPAAAGSLIALFEGMAKLLQSPTARVRGGHV